MDIKAKGVGVYSSESGEDVYLLADGWTIDVEYSLTVKCGQRTVAFYRDRAWEAVRDVEFDRTAD